MGRRNGNSTRVAQMWFSMERARRLRNRTVSVIRLVFEGQDMYGVRMSGVFATV